jgi:hypothetical protein
VVVAGEGVGVLEADADERSQLEHRRGELEVLWLCAAGGDEGVEAEEGAFGLREELGCLGEVVCFEAFELLDELLHCAFRHGRCALVSKLSSVYVRSLDGLSSARVLVRMFSGR